MPGPSPEPARGDSVHLLWHDPPVAAGDYAPAIWVPLTRLLAAHRRVLGMARRLPADVWAAPSAIDGWSRRDVLAHL
ncbi:MAG: maleylpyruvate isomerase N-terminal domain-containing protein, partial [Chloroflexota bacterium]|nr:maleylpyruvate isomerase N-terminal domain-containing protein [Chloroflexota bacterium]